MNIDTQNSWYMSKPLSDCPNLLSEEEADNYQVHFYHCQCGVMEVVLSSNTETPLYQCAECDNKYFIDTSKVGQGYPYLLHKEDLNFIYSYKKIDDGYIVNSYLNIPYQADFMRKELLYKKEFIANMTVSISQRRHLFKLPIKSFKAKDVLKRKMHDFIVEETGNNLVYYEDSLKTQEDIYQFDFNPKLIDPEFYFWKKIDLRALKNPKKPIGIMDMLDYLLNHRKERSLKRTLFKKYTQLLKHSPNPNTFNPLAPFIITRCFDDPNIASKLLAEDLEVFSLEDENDYGVMAFDYTEGVGIPNNAKFSRFIFINLQIWFIKFLKIYYTENQLAKMFLGQHDNMRSFWSDILSMIAGNKRAIKKNFKKVKLTPENIHDEIVRCTNAQVNEKLNKLSFLYEKNYKKACTKIDNIEFRLPSTGRELETWAGDMNNCISGYGLDIKNRQTSIYGAFRDNKILYVIEASPSEINEMSGKYNSEISTADTNIINQWWEK
ncbi:MAG: PcfJ domain-containing protein, partial [Bacteroidales bacterium]|nr:PcfJ domain-containing protein [Bacteroidales bacterium]